MSNINYVGNLDTGKLLRRPSGRARPIAEYALYALILGLNVLAPRAFVLLGGREVYISLFLFSAVILLVPSVRYRMPSRRKTVVILGFVALLGYSLLSLMWGTSTVDAYYLIAPIANALITILAAARLSSGISLDDAERTLFNVACLITLATLFYALKDFRGLSEGLVRLETQMGGASMLHVPLLLAFAIYFSNLQKQRRVVTSTTLGAVAILLIILTGSRAGIISAGILVVLIVIRIVRPAYAVLALGIVAGVAFVALKHIPSERLLDLSDSARSVNYDSGINAVLQSPQTILFGRGSGSIWPWYYDTAVGGDPSLSLSPYGPLLRNPHSLPIGVFVEAGVVGLILLFVSIGVIVYSALVWYIRKPLSFFGPVGIALVVSSMSFFTEYHLLSNFPLAFVWWFVAFQYLRHRESSRLNDSERALDDAKRTAVGFRAPSSDRDLTV